MTQALANSLIVEQYMYNTYPCLRNWLDHIKLVLPQTLNYDSVSCAQLAMISRSAMKAFDYISIYDTNVSVIRISKLMNDLHNYAWQTWVTFVAQSNVATGIRTVSLTPTALQGITTFSNWDIVLNGSPLFYPPTLLNNVLIGVTV